MACKRKVGVHMQKNYRTKCKDGIMEYLEKNKEQSFCAYDIHSYLQNQDMQVNITTIYRNLDKLTDQGILMKYKTSEDESFRYQYVKPHGNCQEHLHMQCRGCGKVLHLECSFMKELSGHLKAHHRFSLECTGSVLIGLCEKCVSIK